MPGVLLPSCCPLGFYFYRRYENSDSFPGPSILFMSDDSRSNFHSNNIEKLSRFPKFDDALKSGPVPGLYRA